MQTNRSLTLLRVRNFYLLENLYGQNFYAQYIYWKLAVHHILQLEPTYFIQLS